MSNIKTGVDYHNSMNLQNVERKYNPDDLVNSYNPSDAYPKIEGEFKEEEYGQVPLRVSVIDFGDSRKTSEKEWRLIEEWGQTYDEKMKSWETCKRVLRSGFQNFLMFGHKEKGLFWFRFKHNNKGFHIKNTKLHPLLFSERIGKTGFSIGNWHFKWLKKYEG